MWLLRYLKRLVIVRIPADLRRCGDLLLAQEVGGLGAYLLHHPVVVVGESMGCQHLGLLQTSLRRCYVQGARFHPWQARVLLVELRISQVVVGISVVVALPKDVPNGAVVASYDVFQSLKGVALFPFVVSEVLRAGSETSLVLVASPDGVILQFERIHRVLGSLWPLEDVDAWIVLLAHWAPVLALPAVRLHEGVLSRSPGSRRGVLVLALYLVYI